MVAAFGTIVAAQHRGGAPVQFFDRGKPRQSERLARDHHDQCQRGGRGKSQPEQAEAFAAREQILDQVR